MKNAKARIRNVRLGVACLYLFMVLCMGGALYEKPILVSPLLAVEEALPTPTPTPTPEDQTIEGYIKAVFGKHSRMAIAVAKGECRGFRLDCKLVTEKEWSVGIFQINIRAHSSKIPARTYEEKEAWLFDWRNNVLMAKIIFDASGWYPWSAFLNQSYKDFL